MNAARPRCVTGAAWEVRRLSLRWLTPLTRTTLRALGVSLPDTRPAPGSTLGEDETAWREHLKATDRKPD